MNGQGWRIKAEFGKPTATQIVQVVDQIEDKDEDRQKALKSTRREFPKKTDAWRPMPSLNRESRLLSPEMRGRTEGGENNKFLCERRVK